MTCFRAWVVLVLAALPGTLGFSFFAAEIPNGARVPSPCQGGVLWPGVGHLNRDGGGATNPFGADFNRLGNVCVCVCGVGVCVCVCVCVWLCVWVWVFVFVCVCV